jgi:hypothetical protein
MTAHPLYRAGVDGNGQLTCILKWLPGREGTNAQSRADHATLHKHGFISVRAFARVWEVTRLLVRIKFVHSDAM